MHRSNTSKKKSHKKVVVGRKHAWQRYMKTHAKTALEIYPKLHVAKAVSNLYNNHLSSKKVKGAAENCTKIPRVGLWNKFKGIFTSHAQKELYEMMCSKYGEHVVDEMVKEYQKSSQGWLGINLKTLATFYTGMISRNNWKPDTQIETYIDTKINTNLES